MLYEDYIKETRENAREDIEENAQYYESFEEMEEALFLSDSVTGNGSGSYTFNTAQAAENVAAIIWDEDFTELCKDYGYDGVPMDKGPEAIDVLARCFALSELYGELEEYYNEIREG